MINILSYAGMNKHSEICLWTLLGLVRTIFDATLFKVNANLKQVWQMTMPEDLSMSVQRMLRTMISGVMLVQCFTVYVYLASYIVLLYPVFLEERPTLVLPWLLLAATRKLLCELTSLALGLGTCVLLGPARPPCIKFVIMKFVLIMPAFYFWMLMFDYYRSLKISAAFKTFTTGLPSSDQDYGLELAIRRRRTKSLLGEDQLRTKIVASLYGDGSSIINDAKSRPIVSSRDDNSPNTSIVELKTNGDMLTPTSAISHRLSETGSYEDRYESDVVVPRDADRILEQFVLMILRIGAYLKKEGVTSVDFDTFRKQSSEAVILRHNSHNCATITAAADDTDTPHFVGSSKGNTASYVREYPQIFMKRFTEHPLSSESKIAAVKTVHNTRVDKDDNINNNKEAKNRKRIVSISPNENINKREIIFENDHLQNSETESHPRPLKSIQFPEGKYRDLVINEPEDVIIPIVEPEIDLKNIMFGSSDSLRSLIENAKRIRENKNISYETDSEETSNSKLSEDMDEKKD